MLQSIPTWPKTQPTGGAAGNPTGWEYAARAKSGGTKIGDTTERAVRGGAATGGALGCAPCS
jgi:hypothetical protein